MFALTKRLTLRPGWPEDAAALHAAIAHESVVRNLARVPWPYRLEDAADYLSRPRVGHDPTFQIIAHDGHRLIGGIGLMRDVGDGHELGYWLAPDAWGRGYATEAGRAVIDMARHALGIRRIDARYALDNPASGRVLRKLGFREAGRGSYRSIGRGTDIACAEMVLDLDGKAEVDEPMPIAA